MSSFEPNKRHLRELFIYFFNLKKSAAEAHRLLVERYGVAALSEKSRCEWFQKFKNGENGIEDKEHSGRPKVYKYAEWEALLNQDSCQTQDELARTLGVTQQAISHRSKSVGVIQKHGNWVPYDCMQNAFSMITQKGRNHGDHLSMLQHLQLRQIFMEKTLVVYLVGSAWCRVL